MGKILPEYKYSLIKELKDNISNDTSRYYMFASNPIEANTLSDVANNDIAQNYEFTWSMLFGKKIANNDIAYMIKKNIWTTNTVYDRYDQTSNTMFDDNNYYVISEPAEVGGVYNIYKCIDNSNNASSTSNPGSIGSPTQQTTFETADGYKWRYITTITSSVWDKFTTTEYCPVYPNTSIQSTSKDYSGIDIVVVSNTGTGYESYTNGVIQSIVNTSLLQIANTATTENFKYNNSAIYMYNTSLGSYQVRTISNYVANSTGKWVYLSEVANTSLITAGSTEYYISPRVVFETDGDTSPLAYSVVNSTSNTIHEIIVLDSGSNINRANVYLTSTYGNGANLYCIIPPPGGHGYNPMRELNIKGLGISVYFANTERGTIITSNVVYNKIGIIKDPYTLEADFTKGSAYTSNTFDQVFVANVSPSHTFDYGDTIEGVTSGARGIVVFSNSTHLHIVGDNHFIEGEYIGNNSIANSTQIYPYTIADIYYRDLAPLYVQNINNINRSNTQTESYKIIIQV